MQLPLRGEVLLNPLSKLRTDPRKAIEAEIADLKVLPDKYRA